jgi:hypothetical protein
VDRYESGLTWTGFREANGIISAQKIHKVTIDGEPLCVAAGGERIAGKILDLRAGFAAYFWDVVVGDAAGKTAHNMVRLGMFPDRDTALAAIGNRFSWSKTEEETLQRAAGTSSAA